MAMVFGASVACACGGDATGGAGPAAIDPISALPVRADVPLVVAGESAHGPRVHVAWVGARGALARREGARLVYPSAFGEGFDLEREVRADGVEDWVRLPRAPERRELRLRVSTEGFAGLRLVAGTLELLDDHGTPRVRMSPPWARDRAGKVHTVGVEVEGCAVSRDPRPPWGMPPVAPGAATCDVVLPLDLPDDAYPAVLDPLWGQTGSLAVPRAIHTATTLGDGRVLVVGGSDTRVDLDTTSAELYDPTSGTFAATGPLVAARRAHLAVRLEGGDVAVLGGDVGLGVPSVLSSIERYDTRSGRFVAGGTLTRERTHATATVLAGGEVLVAGGLSYATGLSFDDAELCTRDVASCRPTRALPGPRADHAAVRFGDGRVLVTGGAESVFNDDRPRLATSTLFDRASETWTDGPPLPAPRFGHVAVTGADGRVLIVGGALAAQGATIADDVLVLAPGATRFVPAGRLIAPRWLHGATMLPTGNVLVTGTATAGYQLGASTSAELFDPRSGLSREVGAIHRTSFAAHALLNDGRALVVGGGRGMDSASAYLFADDPPDAGPRDAGPDAAADAAGEPLDATPSPRSDATPSDVPSADETRGFYACSSHFPERESPIAPLVLAAAVAASAARRRRR
ncbi:MAG: kelch repeat-containing protein [Polyangiaceae bacterium]